MHIYIHMWLIIINFKESKIQNKYQRVHIDNLCYMINFIVDINKLTYQMSVTALVDKSI